jgi:type I restriction-modification system DNA methylase subunit
MKSTWFSQKHHHTFAKCLEETSFGSRSMWETFSDFLNLAYLSLSQAVCKFQTGEMNAEKEKEFLAIEARYKYPAKFREAMAHLVMGLDRERYDFLGSVAGELELLSSWNGQFFTPKAVCDLMARMTMGEQLPDPDRRLTICEPACGAGAMAIAVTNVLHEKGFMPWNYWLTAVDVDPKMFMATYIQLTLCGVPANVIWGNSLSLEEHRNETTLVGVLHPYRRSAVELLEDANRSTHNKQQKAAQALAQATATREARITQNKGQLDFDFAA